MTNDNIKLSLSAKYLSIRALEPIELPRFTVLTGLNGSGKTHLLEAIRAGNVKVDGIDQSSIHYFSYSDFLLTSNKAMTAQQIDAAQQMAWEALNGAGNAKVKSNWLGSGGKIYQSTFPAADCPPENRNKIWSCDLAMVDPSEAAGIARYRKDIQSRLFENEHFRANAHFKLIEKALKKADLPIHEVSESMFRECFVPYGGSNQQSFLTSGLGTIFTKYRGDQIEWVANKQYQAPTTPLAVAELLQEFETNHLPPWELMNSILRQVNSNSPDPSVFNFELTLPEKHIPPSERHSFSFEPRILDRNSGEERGFNELSSGEKVLLALAYTVYESQDGFSMPEIILLDEVDATLHPSMVSALLKTLQEVFVARGVAVMLATHSPTTVALADEASLFVVQKTGSQRVKKETRQVAVSYLSEGIATVEGGLRLADQLVVGKLNLITEGHNYLILQKLFQLYGITDVELVRGLEDISGKNQLSNYFQLFSRLPHESPILIVVDPDVKMKVAETNLTYWYRLEGNSENKIVRSGIENLFDLSILKPYLETTTTARGDFVRHSFNNSQKKEFAETIQQEGTKEDFHRFAGLLEKIISIQSESTQSNEQNQSH